MRVLSDGALLAEIDLPSRPLPGTDLIAGSLVLGARAFSGQPDEAACEQVVRHALNRGVTMLDTAPTDSGGLAEEIVGRLLL